MIKQQPAGTEVHSPNCFGEKVHEVNIGLVRHSLPSAQHSVVGTLHKGLLKLDGMLDARMLECLDRQKLQLSVELCNSILDQQPQKIESQNWVLLW